MDLELYPGSTTPDERAEVDRRNFEDDPETLVSLIRENYVKSIRTGSCTITD